MTIQKWPSVTHTGKALYYTVPDLTTVCWRDLGPEMAARTYRYAAAKPVTLISHQVLVTELVAKSLRGRWEVAADLLDLLDPLIARRTVKTIAQQVIAWTIAKAASHDLHEPLIGEWPAQLKQVVPQLKQIDDAWKEHVERSIFGETYPWPKSFPDFVIVEAERLIKTMDNRSVDIEKAHWNIGSEGVAWRFLGSADKESMGLYESLLTRSDEDAWKYIRDCIEFVGGSLPE